MKRLIFLAISTLFCVSAFCRSGHFVSSDLFSSGLINALCQDRYGYMWIATDYGLNKYDGYRFTPYIHHPGDSTSLSSNVVCCVFCDRDGALWVGTSKGLDRYNYATSQFEHYPFPRGRQPRVTKIEQLKDGSMLVSTSGYSGIYRMKEGKVLDYTDRDPDLLFINSVMEDKKGRIWMCSFTDRIVMRDKAGLHNLNTTQGYAVDFMERGDEVLVFCLHGIDCYRDGQLTKSDIDASVLGGHSVIRCVYTDRQGNIYIGTRGDGLFVLPHDRPIVEPFDAVADGIDLATAKIWAIAEDRDGGIWLGCQSKGLMIIPEKEPQFRSWSFAAQGYHLSSTVTSVATGDNGIVWCSVQGNGVYGFDRDGHVVAHPAAPPLTECIYRDSQGNYWIGTGDALYSYNPMTGQSVLKASFSSDKFNSMTDDGQGHLYISTFSRGFCVYDMATGSLRNYSSTRQGAVQGGLCNDWIMSMLLDRSGYLWIATSSGVCCYDPRTDGFRPFSWRQLLYDVLCYSLCELRDGNILIGSEQGLYVYKPGAKEAERFPNSEVLSDKAICAIVETNDGNFWCATSMGIWQYDAHTKKFIGHVNGNGLTAKEYLASVGGAIGNQLICFATNDGFTVFHPDEVTGSHRSLADVALTGMYLDDKPVTTLTESNGRRVADGPVFATDHFCVSYLDNSITLEFSLLDYNNPANIIYEYRIGDEWRSNREGQNVIHLNHLQPGTYEVEVRALSGGVYSAVKTITLEVTPPWYRTAWAYVLYLFGILGLVALFGIFYRRHTDQQMDEAKMKFLINATHDIRSPLTLIMAAIEKLKSGKPEEMDSLEQFQTYTTSVLTPSVTAIDRNAEKLMVLVNQILDERRIDKNQLQLHCRETNLVEFISGICKLYQYNAEQRGITFTFDYEKDHVLAWIDRINFDKVVANLLNNAFKYTFDGGEVKVKLTETEKDIELQVTDNGVGFKEEDLSKLFDRFYQGKNSSDLSIQGTGIGLNLCRSITQMHGGVIKASHRPDGKQGSCFTVTLLKGNKHLKQEQIVTDAPAREVLSAGNDTRNGSRQYKILVVDDDREIGDYIVSELGNHYKFSYAPNGKEALKMLLSQNTDAKSQNFDLVISDVMMPEMDGVTLLKRIKGNPNISQLPVILLTSKAAIEYKLEGLKSGADAYIGKPFSMEELHIQIDNLIDGVRRLRGKFTGAATQEQRVENIEVKGNDDALMERIMRSVNANMSNPDFNVDMLATDVGISRAQLHRRMKEITGIASGRFLRNLRMEQAARLLREGKVNISQVADRVGYADQAHFSTAFKNHFGQSPSEYAGMAQ